MTGKNIAVFGIFRSREAAQEAVESLQAEGFRTTDISVLFPDNRGTKDLAHEKHTKAPEGTTAGTVTGGAIGGILGGLVGAGALVIPALGPVLAAGPILGALAGVGSGGVVGGVIGALVGLGMPEYEAKRYEGRVRNGGILLSVHCDNGQWVKRAKLVLEETGADDISASGEEKADFAVSDKPMPRVRRAGSGEVLNPEPVEPQEIVSDDRPHPLHKPRDV